VTSPDVIDDRPPTEAELQELLAALSPAADICGVDWNPAWTAWRLSSRAHRDYAWSVFRREGRVHAAAVTGRADATTGTIAALLGTEPVLLGAALHHALDRLRTAGLARVRTIANAPAAVVALRRAGFIRIGANPFIVRSMTGRNLGGNIHHFPSWRILPGDVDTL
jgi:hypothetical protein